VASSAQLLVVMGSIFSCASPFAVKLRSDDVRLQWSILNSLLATAMPGGLN